MWLTLFSSYLRPPVKSSLYGVDCLGPSVKSSAHGVDCCHRIWDPLLALLFVMQFVVIVFRVVDTGTALIAIDA